MVSFTNRLYPSAVVQGHRQLAKLAKRSCSASPSLAVQLPAVVQRGPSPSFSAVTPYRNGTTIKVEGQGPYKARKEKKIGDDPNYLMIKKMVSGNRLCGQSGAHIISMDMAHFSDDLINAEKFVKIVSSKKFLRDSAEEYFKSHEHKEQVLGCFNKMLDSANLSKIKTKAQNFCEAILKGDTPAIIEAEQSLCEAFNIFKLAEDAALPMFLL